MIRKKRALTLIEAIVAFGLFGILASFLFMSYQGVSKISQKTQESRKNLEGRSWAYHRIEKTLENATMEHDDSVFFSEEPAHNSLVFTYNNGIDTDPRFSSIVLGKIYLNVNNELCLATWPLNSRWGDQSCRVEVLLKDIDRLSFEFYLNPPPSNLTVETKKISKGSTPEPGAGLSTHWLNDYELLPHQVNVIAVQKINHKSLELCFPAMLENKKIYLK